MNQKNTNVPKLLREPVAYVIVVVLVLSAIVFLQAMPDRHPNTDTPTRQEESSAPSTADKPAPIYENIPKEQKNLPSIKPQQDNLRSQDEPSTKQATESSCLSSEKTLINNKYKSEIAAEKKLHDKKVRKIKKDLSLAIGSFFGSQRRKLLLAKENDRHQEEIKAIKNLRTERLTDAGCL